MSGDLVGARSYLILLTCAVFLARLGQGLLTGIRTDLFVQTLSLSGSEILWLTGTLRDLLLAPLVLPMDEGLELMYPFPSPGLLCVCHRHILLPSALHWQT
jgi:hypothetical protein